MRFAAFASVWPRKGSLPMQLPTVPSPAKPEAQPPQVVPPGHRELVSQAEEHATHFKQRAGRS